MITIYKYPLLITDEQEIEIPFGSKILTAKFQQGSLFIWAEVDTEKMVVKKKIFLFGTGHEITQKVHEIKYISTVFMLNQSIVWHIFEYLY